MTGVSRRGFLTGLTGLVGGFLVPGCGKTSSGWSDPPNNKPSSSKISPSTNQESYQIGARFADGYLAPSVLAAGFSQRAPFILLGTDGWPAIDGVPNSLQISVIHDRTIIHEDRLERHGEPGVTPYYPLVFTPQEPGDYQLLAEGVSSPYKFRVINRKETGLIQIGDLMRPVDTPTINDPRGVEPICTYHDGVCPLHDFTLTEALDAEGPTALLISTPRFCQTDVCGPALEVLLSLYQGIPGLTAIHAEVWTNEKLQSLTPAVTTYNLDLEPSLVVANSRGAVCDVLHFAMDTREVRKALRRSVN